MQVPPFENPWIKKTRLLTHLLIGSLTLNVGLFTSFCCRSKTVHRSQDVKKYVKMSSLDTIQSVVGYLETLSKEDVVEYLQDKTPLEHGIFVRDIALCFLMQEYGLDVDRVLALDALEKRYVKCNQKEFFVFYGLSDRDFSLLHGWIRQGNFIVSLEGLFKQIQLDPHSLAKEYFCQRSEFCMLYTILHHHKKDLTENDLFSFMIKAPIDLFLNLIEMCKQEPNLSIDHFRPFFLQYIQTQASLWIYLDADFVVKSLSNEHLIQCIDALQEDIFYNAPFLQHVFLGPREKSIRELAGKKLCEVWQKELPEEISWDSLYAALFEKLPEKQTQVQKKEQYIVQDGDSLWKIAQKYRITTDSLREENQLQKDLLRPGQVLVIPSLD